MGGKNPNFINIPVIGGHAGVTIMPVFSQDKVANSIDKEKIPDLDKHVQNAGTDVVDAKGGKGTECAYVASDITDLPYFSSKVLFGEGGVVKVHPVGELNEYETKRLAEASEA